jgi:hypothetical protein
MRSIGNEEINQVSGGYYFYDTVQGAQAGAILGYGAFLCSQTPFTIAIGTGVALGMIFGLMNAIAYDIDVSLWGQYYYGQIPAPYSSN